MIFHDVNQNGDDGEWMSLRTGRVTMSNAGKLMANFGKAFGDPAKDYALQIALEIATGRKSEFGFSNEHMQRGHDQEPIARMMYENENFVSVTNGGFFDCGDYGTSPDGLVGDNGIIEIKSVIPKTHRATIKRAAIDPAYKWQVIGHLDCTGRDWCDFVSYCSDYPESKQLVTYRVNRCDVENEIEQLRERRNQFMLIIAEELKELNR